MKNLIKALFAVAVVSLGVFSCQKTIDQPDAPPAKEAGAVLMANGEECVPGPFDVVFISKTYLGNGTWEWIWSIDGRGTGNGDYGTHQDLSHVDWVYPACVEQDNVVSIAWKTSGPDWTYVNKVPVVDPSISNTCPAVENPPSVKFGIGAEVGMFKIVVNKNFEVGYGIQALYKSGVNTGCGYLCYEGISCIIPPEPRDYGCSFSQGFWFVKPYGEANMWPGGTLTMGGKVYTPEEARALWWVNGNIELKRAFTQAGTIKLSLASGYLTNGAATAAYVSSIDGVLAGLPKLTPDNIVAQNKALSAVVRKSLGQWGGAIGDWIDANHCEKLASPY